MAGGFAPDLEIVVEELEVSDHNFRLVASADVAGEGRLGVEWLAPNRCPFDLNFGDHLTFRFGVFALLLFWGEHNRFRGSYYNLGDLR